MSRRRAPARARPAATGGALDSQAVRPPGPVRTCVGCRARAAKTDLMRVVADGDRLVPDLAGRAPGRGASVHRDPHCIDLAEQRRAFPRALRLPGPLDLQLVREAVQAGPAPQAAPARQAGPAPQAGPAAPRTTAQHPPPSREQVEPA